MSTYGDQLSDGYSQSKWVSEQLVQRAKSRGLPVVIYRLGTNKIICPFSQNCSPVFTHTVEQ